MQPRAETGYCITGRMSRDKMLEHHNKYSTNKKTMIAKETKKKEKKKEILTVKKTKLKGKKTNIMDSQMPGPSHIPTTNTNNSSESDYEDENIISDDIKCCVCKLFTPKEVRESPCLIFTKLVQCDHCRHWVHLIYCTEKRAIRKGDGFLCLHCKSD